MFFNTQSFQYLFLGQREKRTKRCVRLELKNFNCVCEEEKLIWIAIGMILFMFDPLICILQIFLLMYSPKTVINTIGSDWGKLSIRTVNGQTQIGHERGGRTDITRRESRWPTPTLGLRSEASHRRRSLLWRPETARIWCCCTAAGNTKSQESCVRPQSNSNNM